MLALSSDHRDAVRGAGRRGRVPGSSKHVDGEDGRGENRGADDQDGRQRDG